MNKFLSKSIVLSILASLPVPALAGERKPFSTDAIELANVLKNCAAEVAALAKEGPANTIDSASHVWSKDLDIYSVEFSAGGFAPSFGSYPVGTLKVTRKFVRSTFTAPDAPGGHFEWKCGIAQPAK